LLQNSNVSQISSADINAGNKTLLVFLCTSIDGNDNFINSTLVNYRLTSQNLNNNFLSQNLKGSTATFSMPHSDLCDIATQEENYSLCKEYKIIFRLTNFSNPLTTSSLQDGDIVNDFKLMFDTFQQGSYDVSIVNADLLNPEVFSEAELLEVYANNAGILGFENLRIFYPSQIDNLSNCPLIIIVHGQNHNPLMYDIYQSLFASYGYIAVSVQGYVGDGFGSPNTASRIGKILRHLKLYNDKIFNEKFINKIDFTKIFLIGHSVGALSVSGFVEYTKQGISIPVVPNFSLNDIVALCTMEGSNLGASSAEKPTFYIGGIDSYSYDHPSIIGVYGNTYFKAGYLLKTASHEDLAYPFSPVNAASGFPILPISSLFNTSVESYSFITNTVYSFNNRTFSQFLAAERLLQFFSICFKNKIQNYWNLNNFDYEETNKKEKLNTGFLFYRYPSASINFIETYGNSNQFTTDISGATIVSGLTNQNWSLQKLPNLFPNKSFSTFNPSYPPTVGYSGNSGYVIPYDGTTKSITYNLSGNPLNLSGNSYITILASVVHAASNTGSDPNFPIIPSLGNNLYTNFGIELTCNNGATAATINSRQNNFGIMDAAGGVGQHNINSNNASVLLGYPQPSSQINFLASDFKNKVPGLTLSNITELKIHFNAAQGTTSPNGYFIFDGIYIK
jgi:hypothetical protein